MIRNFMIGILVVGLSGALWWGYSENKENKDMALHIENNYQRAFYDLSEDLHKMNDKIGSTLAMNSRKSLSPTFAEVWKVSDEAQTSLAELPFGGLPFSKTQELLTDIGHFAYTTSIRDLDKKPLSEAENKTLNNLYKRSGEILKDIQGMQKDVSEKNLKFADAESIVKSQKRDEMKDNQIIDGFKNIENDVDGYDLRSDFGPDFSTADMRTKTFKNVSGKNITEKEAINRAKQFAKVSKVSNVKVTCNRKGSKYGFYNVSFNDKSNKNHYTVDLTKKGGHLIFFINDRKIKEQKYSLSDVVEGMEEHLQLIEAKDLELVESTQYDTVGLLTYARVMNGVTIYPDMVKVKIALDNNQIIGLAADEYFENNKQRESFVPTISESAAAEKISKNVQVQDSRLSIIVNDLNEEVLCYEFFGTLEHDTYRIFINAGTNEEELVQKVEKINVL
ncbi:MAG: ypeB [Bacillales bacterium]|jgi:spore germination protein|nr:ypeB [Bacillales bacterium]